MIVTQLKKIPDHHGDRTRDLPDPNQTDTLPRANVTQLEKSPTTMGIEPGISRIQIRQTLYR
ncbi:hypothetical protein DPMN_018077, partial [Dreissena polymorpha]